MKKPVIDWTKFVVYEHRSKIGMLIIYNDGMQQWWLTKSELVVLERYRAHTGILKKNRRKSAYKKRDWVFVIRGANEFNPPEISPRFKNFSAALMYLKCGMLADHLEEG